MAHDLNPFASLGVNRRSFIKTSAVAGTTLLTWRPTLGQGRSLEKINVAAVGVGGQGHSDLGQIAGHADTVIVALCDVDTNSLGAAASQHGNATQFTDFREMFDTMGDKIDAVIVSTPDHMHAPIAMTALNNNKNVYCQKPLAHSISECRALRAAANAKPNLITQMGTQNTAKMMKRRAMKALEEGVVGRVVQLQALTDRAKGWWPQGNPRPEGSDPVPSNLEWDLWLGVAPERPYKKDTYAPFKWRGFRDFGVGAIGDMGCHIMDAPFQTYGLGDPKSVRCETVSNSQDEYPLQEVVKMVLPGVDASGGEDIPFTWFDGGLKPNPSELGLPADFNIPFNVVIVVGEKGTMMIPIPGDGTKFFRKGKERSLELPKAPNKNHWHMWVDAIQGKDTNYTPFDYAGRVSETLAIGAVASNFPNETLEWDAKAMKFTNKPEAAKFVTREYREGWNFKNL
jgi:predicted dehydrogenase